MPERVVTVIVPGTDKSIVTVPDLATTPNVALSAGCSPIKGIFYSYNVGRVSGKSEVLGQSLSFVRYVRYLSRSGQSGVCAILSVAFNS